MLRPLYRYFTARAEFVELKQKGDRQATNNCRRGETRFQGSQKRVKRSRKQIKGLRQLTMEDYDAERKQLKINFDH